MLLVLAIAAGAALLLQRQAAAQLRSEVALLREDNAQLARLRMDHAKLVAAQPPAADLERLRADRDAVVRLRAEIGKLKAGVEQRENALKLAPVAAATPDETEPPPIVHVLRAATRKNAGRATPVAALETALWAGASGNVDELAGTLSLTDGAMQKAQAMFDGLPEATQKDCGSPFGLIATLMTKDMPIGDVRLTEVKSTDPDPTSMEMDAELRNREGQATTAHFQFQKTEDHWTLWVPEKMVDHLAAMLRGGPLVKTDGGGK